MTKKYTHRRTMGDFYLILNFLNKGKMKNVNFRNR